MSENLGVTETVRDQIRARARGAGWEAVTEIVGLDSYEKDDKKMFVYYQRGSEIVSLSYVDGPRYTRTDMEPGLDLGAYALRLIAQSHQG